LAVLSAITLLFHVLTAKGYGYFRDELYYLACGEHLGFGYVDHPPLVALIAASTRAALGESLWAIRFPSAVAAAATVWIVGATAREMGGGRFAQTLAALATMLAPIYVSLSSILSMNAFDVLFWAASWWIIARILREGTGGGRERGGESGGGGGGREGGEGSAGGGSGGDPRWWLALGVVAGIGLENKISVLFLLFGLAAGLLAARRWEAFRTRGPWLAGGLALLIFLPHILWQVAHGWPTLEFMDNARRHKMAPLSPPAFLSEQVLHAGPAALPIWLAGLAFFLFLRGGRPWRALGWAYLALLAVMIATRAKAYYLAPAHAVLFAGGAVAIEGWTSRRPASLRAAIALAFALLSLPAIPLAKPLLPVDLYVRYAARLGMKPSTGERQALGRLPQFFADMHGWPELAAAVAKVYAALPADEQSRACIFGQNYGEAGAIDFFGKAYGLPKAISSHNSYHLWGPRGCSGEIMIVIGGDEEDLLEFFTSVTRGATFTCADCMPYENDLPIWVARGLRRPVSELWPTIRSFI
jgi:hypothetical protein